MDVKLSVKGRIVFDGKEYGSPEELPEHVRAAYEKAFPGGVAGKVGAASAAHVAKITFNGHEYASAEAMPEDVRRIHEDVMAAIANGELVPEPSARAVPRPTAAQASVELGAAESSARPIEPAASSSRVRWAVALFGAALLVALYLLLGGSH